MWVARVGGVRVWVEGGGGKRCGWEVERSGMVVVVVDVGALLLLWAMVGVRRKPTEAARSGVWVGGQAVWVMGVVGD